MRAKIDQKPLPASILKYSAAFGGHWGPFGHHWGPVGLYLGSIGLHLGSIGLHFGLCGYSLWSLWDHVGSILVYFPSIWDAAGHFGSFVFQKEEDKDP